MAGVVDRFAAILRAPLRAAALLVRGDRQLAELRALSRSTKKAAVDLAKGLKHADQRIEKHDDRLTGLETKLEAMRRELSADSQRVSLQLTAITRALQQVRASANGDDAAGNGHAKRLSARSIPLEVEAAETTWSAVIGGDLHPDPRGQDWISYD